MGFSFIRNNNKNCCAHNDASVCSPKIQFQISEEMGNLMNKNKKIDISKLKAGETEILDTRRRNSLAFNITKFMKHDGDDFDDLLKITQAERNALLENVVHNMRDESKAIY
jgi:hypothetical protein